MTASTKTAQRAKSSGLLLTLLGLGSLATCQSLRAQESAETAWHSVLELELETQGAQLPGFPTARVSSGQAGYRPSSLASPSRYTSTALPLAPNSPSQSSGGEEHTRVSGVAFRQQEPDRRAGESIQTPQEFHSGWTLKSVDELELSIFDERRLPDNVADAILQAAPQGDQHQMVDVGAVATWIAPNLTYQPLLFEDARLERHGYASPYFAVQPIRSGFHFTNSSLLFPFRAWSHRNQMESPLAFERPGSPAPPSREIFVPAVGHR